uniref:Uncharacterized protein n=1 Tax=Rathayibacter iranicus TaxID=59737 RepID=A0A5J6SH00_9MICO|nr:hypothetical protein [Rathayibacter iranicus]QFF92415.1 hypothetical protein [Rathayibacter iranicus]
MLSRAHKDTEMVPSAPAWATTSQANNQERSVVVQFIRHGHDMPGGSLSAGGADQVGAVLASFRPPARGVLLLTRASECGAYREKSGRKHRDRRLNWRGLYGKLDEGNTAPRKTDQIRTGSTR